MSANLDTLRVQQFANTIRLLLQQDGSRLRNAVMSGMHIGKQASPVDQIAAVTAQKVTGRYQPIGRVDAVFDRRWVFPVDYDLNQIIDTFDLLRLLNDPKSSYVQNAVNAMGRAIDDEIIAAYFGTSITGETAGTSTTFPAGQQVAVNQGAASNTGLTVAKLREAKRLLMAAQVDPNSPLYCVITAKQHDDLLAETQVIHKDFNAGTPTLVEGRLTKFMGFEFIHCERLITDASAYRRIPAYDKTGMYFADWDLMKTSVSQREDIKGLPWQAYVHATFGATRLEEKRVVEIKCSEA